MDFFNTFGLSRGENAQGSNRASRGKTLDSSMLPSNNVPSLTSLSSCQSVDTVMTESLTANASFDEIDVGQSSKSLLAENAKSMLTKQLFSNIVGSSTLPGMTSLDDSYMIEVESDGSISLSEIDCYEDDCYIEEEAFSDDEQSVSSNMTEQESFDEFTGAIDEALEEAQTLSLDSDLIETLRGLSVACHTPRQDNSQVKNHNFNDETCVRDEDSETLSPLPSLSLDKIFEYAVEQESFCEDNSATAEILALDDSKCQENERCIKTSEKVFGNAQPTMGEAKISDTLRSIMLRRRFGERELAIKRENDNARKVDKLTKQSVLAF